MTGHKEDQVKKKDAEKEQLSLRTNGLSDRLVEFSENTEEE
jgi:hypothetical protein